MDLTALLIGPLLILPQCKYICRNVLPIPWFLFFSLSRNGPFISVYRKLSGVYLPLLHSPPTKLETTARRFHLELTQNVFFFVLCLLHDIVHSRYGPQAHSRRRDLDPEVGRGDPRMSGSITEKNEVRFVV